FCKPRRKNRAFIHSAQARASGFEVTDSGRGGAGSGSNLPLRAISVTVGWRSMRGNRPVPPHVANATESFAQDFGFVAELRFVRDVLVLAAAATPEIRAGGRDALGG